jgi:hypothetical protein
VEQSRARQTRFAVTDAEAGLPSDRPFRRWQDAVGALADAEKRDPYGPDADRFAVEVIAARLALTQARIADGWTPHQAVVVSAAADAVLLTEGTGAIDEPAVTATNRD